MAIDVRTVAVLDGSTALFTDRIILGMKYGVANVIGGGAGAAVVTAVTFAEPLPASYMVIVACSQDATAFVSGKTASGFNVTLEPRLAANTLAAGTFDFIVLA